MIKCSVYLFSDDQAWYRATLVRYVSNTAAEVTFVDFGNGAVVPLQNIRPIYEYFMHLPSQVFVVSLADVIPNNGRWTAESNQLFQDLVLDKHLTAFIKAKGISGFSIFDLLLLR